MRRCFVECLGGNAISERSTEPQPSATTQHPLSGIEEKNEESAHRPLKGILKKSPTDSLSSFYSPTPVRRQHLQSNRSDVLQCSTHVVVKPSERRHVDVGSLQETHRELQDPLGYSPLYFHQRAAGFPYEVLHEHIVTPFAGHIPNRSQFYTASQHFQGHQETLQRSQGIHTQFVEQPYPHNLLRSGLNQQVSDRWQNGAYGFNTQFPGSYPRQPFWQRNLSSIEQQREAHQESVWRRRAGSLTELTGSSNKRLRHAQSFRLPSGNPQHLLERRQRSLHSQFSARNHEQANGHFGFHPYRTHQGQLGRHQLHVHPQFLDNDRIQHGLHLSLQLDPESGFQRFYRNHHQNQTNGLPDREQTGHFSHQFTRHRRFRPYVVEHFPPRWSQKRQAVNNVHGQVINSPLQRLSEHEEHTRKNRTSQHIQSVTQSHLQRLRPRELQALQSRNPYHPGSFSDHFTLRHQQFLEPLGSRHQSPHHTQPARRTSNKNHQHQGSFLLSEPNSDTSSKDDDSTVFASSKHLHARPQSRRERWKADRESRVLLDSAKSANSREHFTNASASAHSHKIKTRFSAVTSTYTTESRKRGVSSAKTTSAAESGFPYEHRPFGSPLDSLSETGSRKAEDPLQQGRPAGCSASNEQQHVVQIHRSDSSSTLSAKQDTDRKREAFYEMLASRYPQYADKITGLSAYHNPSVSAAAERNSRPREPQRRRTTVPAFSHYNSRSLDYDDPGTMSDIELSSFQRGGYARASMPIVRSASTSLERPMGLVFLVFRDETKKALLPNEITSLDTVRALFVRAFSEKLSMEYLDSPKRKIYILEASTSIFFQLEDLRDIKDRTVLKIHECDSDEPQYVRCPIELRGRASQPARPASQQGHVRDTGPHFRDEMAKAQSLPVSSAQSYQDMLQKERLQWQREQEYIQEQQRRSRSRSLTPEPVERPRSLSAGPPRGRYSHSPDRLPTPERGPAHLNTIPENPRLLANGFRQTAAANGNHYDHGHPPHGHPSHGHPPPHGHPPHPSAAPPPGRIMSPPPVVYESVYPPQGYGHPQAFVTHSTRAPAPQGPLRATGPSAPDMRGNNRAGPPHRQSLPFAAMSNPVYDSFPQRSQPYRVTPERDVLPPRPQSASSSHEIGRMERMEAQIASLAAWVHQVQATPGEAPPARRNSSRSTSSGHSEGTDTYPASSGSKQNGDSSFSTLPGLSDIPDACTKAPAMVTTEMREKINDMHCRMQELRVELQGLRRMEQLNQEAMRDAFTDTLSKIKKVISAVPGAEEQVVRQQRMEVNCQVDSYRQDRARVDKELSDLESSVEELKQDVLARKCRVNISDVEGLALVLSNITKSLADLKARYPKVHDSLRKVMAGEMEIVVKEEKFIKEEPLQIEAALKRCKKLTSTLYTLKRLATVQDTRPPHVPTLALESNEVGEEEKMAILESIRAMVPDHDTRLQQLEAADASRERKKKIVTQHESLKFTKSLQTASKSLKPPEPQTATTEDGAHGSDKKDASRKSFEVSSDTKRCSEPPTVPAKPARLMLITEPKHSQATSIPSPGPTMPVAHTVTVTSQISCEKKDAESKAGTRGSSRSAFFGCLESPSERSNTASVEMSPTVTVSAVSTSPSSSQAVPVSSVQYQPTRRLSGSDSSHQPTRPEDQEDADKGRRVPPPPPPRKSSARYPYGIGPLSPQSPTESGSKGGGMLQRQHSGDKSPDRGRQPAILMVYKPHTPPTTTTGPLSSTPKPPTPQKPQNLSKLYRAGQTGVKPPPTSQHQRIGADRMFTTFVPPVPAAVITNNQDSLEDDGDLSESESTGSTTSLDSQQGATLVRTNSTPPHRGPKPHPPQRCSSLSLKEGRRGGEGDGTAQTHVVEVRKPLHVETMTVHVNGLGGAENGHKT